jgi:hypothetical protein
VDEKYEAKIIIDSPRAGLIQIHDRKALESHPCPCHPEPGDKPLWGKKNTLPFRKPSLHSIDPLFSTVCFGSF